MRVTVVGLRISARSRIRRQSSNAESISLIMKSHPHMQRLSPTTYVDYCNSKWQKCS